MYLVINFVLFALQIYSLILLARVFLTWFPNIDRSNPLVKMLHDVTEPVLQPIREALPPTRGFDFSPLVVFIGIWILQRLIIGIF